MTKIRIQLDDDVFIALRKFSKQEMRDFRKQAVLIIREKLEFEGLLAVSNRESFDILEYATSSNQEEINEHRN